jgi:hypothetical protein
VRQSIPMKVNWTQHVLGLSLWLNLPKPSIQDLVHTRFGIAAINQF